MLKKNKIFLRFCLCNFEGDTEKNDSPVQIFRKMKYSENDQTTGHFRAFLFFIRHPPHPYSEKKIPVNQLIKNSGLNRINLHHFFKEIKAVFYFICPSINQCCQWVFGGLWASYFFNS